ncbi:MAG: hypothetical protein V4581_12040 [Bacteroidota bacterium]
MKNNSLKNYLLAILFLVNFTAFADTGSESPGDDSGDNQLEGLEAPINSNILALGIAGILIGAYYFSSKTKKA